jgi:hypothetical protein
MKIEFNFTLEERTLIGRKHLFPLLEYVESKNRSENTVLNFFVLARAKLADRTTILLNFLKIISKSISDIFNFNRTTKITDKTD